MNARENLKFVLGKVVSVLEPQKQPTSVQPPLVPPSSMEGNKNPPSIPPSRRGVKRKDPFTNRAEWERRLTRKLGSAFKDQLDELMALLGDPPRMENIPPSYWENGGKALRSIFEATLTEIALDRATEYLVAAPIGGVDWTLVHEAAVAWARHYSFDLVKGIEDVTREAVRLEVQRFFEDPEAGIDVIAKNLEYYFSETRAEMIAVTETTRAAVEGELEVVREIERYGVQMEPVWQTANDDVVCEICGPKHGEVITDEEFPPAHPRCRCWVTHRVVK